MPVTALGTHDDLGSGRLLPSTSVTQYAATLGGWLGLSAGEHAQRAAQPGPILDRQPGVRLTVICR